MLQITSNIQTHLDQEEVHPERWQPPRQLDISDLGVDLGRPGQPLVLGEDLLLDLVHAGVVRGKEFAQAGNKSGFKYVPSLG